MDRVDVTELRPGIYRLSGFFEVWGITINQFLLVDERPMLIETGLPQHFPLVIEAVRTVIDPSLIAYFAVPHFEPDECGSLNEFLAVARGAEVVSSSAAAYASLTYFVNRPTRGLEDGEVVDLGSLKVKNLFVPHVHSWDSSVFVELTEGVAFTADLFMQKGNVPAIRVEDLSREVAEVWQGYFGVPARYHLLEALDKIERLAPRMLAPVHGSALSGDLTRYFEAMRAYARLGP